MNYGLLKISWVNIQSAVVYGVVSMFFAAIITVGNAIKDHGSIFGLDWHNIIDTTAMVVLSIFVALTSVIKNLLTTEKGNFLGSIKVIPDTK